MIKNELDMLIDYYYRQLSLGLEVDNTYNGIYKYKLDIDNRELSLIEFLYTDEENIKIPDVFEKIDADLIGYVENGSMDGEMFLKSVDFNNVKECKGILCPTIESVKSDYIEVIYSTFAFNSLIKDFNFKNLKKLGEYSFYACSELEFLDLRSVEEIDSHAIIECGNLKEIHLEHIKKLGSRCFDRLNEDFKLVFHNMSKEEVLKLFSKSKDRHYNEIKFEIVED